MSGRNSQIRTLVVDDSAFVRKVVREMLSGSADIDVVGVARDGEEALEMVERLKPDVVTCDLLMPRLDGVGFVRQQMARQPLPILVLTASPADGDRAMDALQAGAIDFMQKPTALATDALRNIRTELVEKVHAAARANGGKQLPVPEVVGQPLPPPLAARSANPTSRFDVVVIGISTGGPQGLRKVIPLFPADLRVPIAMVLHMPVGYTALYAEKLNEICALDVREAKEGDLVRPGMALLAPAGRHLRLERSGAEVRAALTLHPLEKIHRPSADVLFQSASETYGGRVLAVVMTGMGDDGREGAAWVKAQGGSVLTEAEESCVIYGMPRSVVEAGLSDAAYPLEHLAEAIVDRL